MAQNKKIKKKKNTPSHPLVKGRIEFTKSGLAFVITENSDKDIIIKHGYTGTALDGDEVRVELLSIKKNGRQEGVVREVIQRKQTAYSGRLEVQKHFAFLIPDKQNMPVDIFVPLHLLHDGKDGDLAVVQLVEWSEKSKNPVGEVIQIQTHEPPNEIAMQGILMESGFPLSFPKEVLDAAAQLPEGVSESALAQREDFRPTLTFTIDPVDAKDFDDAISIKPLSDGNYEIGVHIADVSHYMTPGSDLDTEAYKRATSVYLPDRVIPMLPERLSNELCSLRPNEEKYTFSAIFDMNTQGVISRYRLGRTLIRSDRRYTYEEVQTVIEGGTDVYQKELMVLRELSQNLRKNRFKNGAINFSSQEVRFQLDENAVPIGITIKESKEAHQLVEELMLLANRTVAEHIAKIRIHNAPLPFPYRVHDVPVEDKLKLFTVFAAKFHIGFDLNSPDKIRQSFNEMLEKVKGRPEQHVLESLGIRTMSKAVYTTDNIGHYGLGFADYCHFTSPIRRYPDVMVHRILQEVLTNQIVPIAKMEQYCRHCSDMERKAMEAERSANKYKQVEYMQQFVGEEFEAVISGVSPFGFWAETIATKCEGMVSIADLKEIDDFELVEQEYALIGQHTGLSFRMGDNITIQVVAANIEKRQIDYRVVKLPEQERMPSKKGRGTTFAPAKKATRSNKRKQ